MMSTAADSDSRFPFPARYLGARLPRYTSYPTADRFAPLAPARVRLWLAAIPAGERISLYVHLPFCPQLCWYCGCHTTITRRAGRVDRYLDDLVAEMAAVGRIIGRRQPVARLHLGGGTPNALTLTQLQRLFAALRRHFALEEADEIAAELDPRLVTPAQAAHLARLGVNRVSLGVQDFDPAVQQAINRPQPADLVRRAVAVLRSAGITRIGFDLMYGLPHQSVAGVRESARLAAAMGPHRIAVFGYAHVPWMKRHQRLLPEDALPDPHTRWAQAAAIARTLEEAGYVPVGFDHFARADDGLARALEEGRLVRNFQGFTDDPAAVVLGLGASAISRFPEGYAQNAVRLDDHRRLVAEEGIATVRGHVLDDEDRLRAAAIMELLCYGECDLAAVCLSHGRGPDGLDDALARLEMLAADGLVTLAGRRVTLRPAARPLARWAAAAIDPKMAGLFGGTAADAPPRHALAV